MTTLALLIVMLLNGGSATVAVEDDPMVSTMANVAMASLSEAGCEPTGWDFNRDASDGLTVTAFGECEFAAQFYRSPETGLWQFAIEGA